MKVRITKLPQARTGYQVQGALVNDVPAMGGVDYNAYIGMKRPKVGSTLTKVPRDKANLEAEGGETVLGNIDGSGMPSFYTIQGPRHHEGGVPLNLPDDSFIYSDTQSMKITDPTILKMFNKPAKKGGYTPAELSKPYDLNKYRKILQDPESDEIARKTAELMIKNYTIKLGALALAQEAKKGFPQGIPVAAQPYMEANKITPEQIMPELAVKKQQRQQPMPEDEGEEPYIEPEAQEEMATMEPGMSPDQMGMPQENMMQMGGMLEQDYMFPYHPTEMAYGGYLPKADNGIITPYEKAKTTQGNVTPTGKQNKFSERQQKLEDYLAQWEDRIPGIENMSEGQAQKAIYEWSLKNNPDAIRKMWKEYGLTNKGLENKKIKALSEKGTGTFTEEMLKDQKLLEQLEDAYVDNFFGARQLDPTPPINESTNEPVSISDDECECTDSVTKEKYTVGKDNNGNCLPCLTETKKCQCPDGSDPGMNDDGTCKDCETIEDDVTGDYGDEVNAKPEAQWWLQDTVNTMGAFGDLMGVRKEMPWEARVKLEEPRPTFLDPTRELAAQSEQANIASQAAAQFAGPQALNARLAAIQGQSAKNAADTLNRYNMGNINIGDQFEANQVGVRNQENMANQAMATRLYDKNIIANQQFQNAKRQGRANMRQAYNTAVTNKWKTDALNQLYPNYQTLAGPGGKVIYTPTEKKLDLEKPGATEGEYYADLLSQGLDPDVAGKLTVNKFKSKKGGDVQRGYIYTDWPIFL